MAKFKNVLSATGEDFVDELVSNIAYRESQTFMSEVKKKMDLDETSYIDEAIESGLSTFQSMLVSATIIVVSEYAITKSGIILTGAISYIKGRNLTKKVASKVRTIASGAKNIPVIGGVIAGLSNAVVGSQEETIAIAKMFNDSGNNIVSAFGQERLVQANLQGQKLTRVDSAKKNIYDTRNTARTTQMELFYNKMTFGQWEKTQRDRKLYIDCTGMDTKKLRWDKPTVNKLNTVGNIVKDAEGNIVSKVELELKMLTALGQNLKA